PRRKATRSPISTASATPLGPSPFKRPNAAAARSAGSGWPRRRQQRMPWVGQTVPRSGPDYVGGTA
ncbi:hypothetical protein, partial [Cryobacterium sp. Y62]|uniref:hypothetical protein n=1 Tax=Cryobacterium sp. Y62 TaxID=2048284 RepID=UPI001E3C9191